MSLEPNPAAPDARIPTDLSWSPFGDSRLRVRARQTAQRPRALACTVAVGFSGVTRIRQE
jgi:hypothetical protein